MKLTESQKIYNNLLEEVDESIDLEDGLYLEMYYEGGTLTIGTESSSGATYNVANKEDLKKSICEYIDSYVGPFDDYEEPEE